MLSEHLEDIFFKNNIVAYMNNYNLYTDCQHVFCKHRSCVTQLHVVEDLSDMFNNGHPYGFIYLILKSSLIKSRIDDCLKIRI